MAKRSVACIALNGRKILVAKRILRGQMGGRWEFPGGKVEDGEDETVAAVREMQEEFAVEIQTGDVIATASFSHNGEEVALKALRIFPAHDGIECRYVLSEHTEYAWIDILDVENLFFVDSDLLLYPAVKNYVLSASCPTSPR